MPPEEKLRCALLLLAGTRAILAGRRAYLAPDGDGFRISVEVTPPRLVTPGWLMVAPDGRIDGFDREGRSARVGHVSDLIAGPRND